LKTRSVLALLVSVSTAMAGPVFAAAEVRHTGPALTIEAAIDAAKRCVLERNVRLVGSYIESTRFVRDAAGARGSFWQVTWAYSREIKDGRVSVAIFGDGSCEVTYGAQAVR
jgi:hypothetical protein